MVKEDDQVICFSCRITLEYKLVMYMEDRDSRLHFYRLHLVDFGELAIKPMLSSVHSRA